MDRRKASSRISRPLGEFDEPWVDMSVIPAPRFHRVRPINIRRFRVEEKRRKLTQVRVRGVRSDRREKCNKIEAEITMRPFKHVKRGKWGT